MRRFSIALVAVLGLSACDPVLGPLDTDAPRIALGGADLEQRLSGRTLVMTTPEGSSVGMAMAVLRSDGTATVSADGEEERSMLWSVSGQGLCFTRPGRVRDADDCRTIGWIQGDRFAVYDSTLNNRKIADGVIR